jgi:hypothetical protein
MAYWIYRITELAIAMTKELSMNDVQELITTAPPEVRKIIERVLKAERDKLYMKNPRHINDDILTIIKEEVQ